eukprot:TRINITY_DN2854_c0_g1_i1.p1 TRINITY_DN2854_c0_g1~~TRINITY_DN2854_c0_g1_i1.p1  ORF type:complete len:287 (-),score=46.38 TRINITY_DN2854_c0_g1_i1:178-957(-)
MVLIKEYRIPLPLSVEEYKIAQLYMVAKFSREKTQNGEGVEVLVNEPYSDGKTSGQYTDKVIHIGSRIPYWAKCVIPTSALTISEKAWNAYPYVKNEYSSPLLGGRFYISTETCYSDRLDEENIHGLSEDLLKVREVDVIDIVNDVVEPAHYKESEDPKLFSSKKTGRGPLTTDWMKTCKQPMMCIYKLVKVNFQVWGIQSRAETYIHKSYVRDIMLLGHRQAFAWMDEWFDMTMEDIRKFELETQNLLNQKFQEQKKC